MVCIIELLVTLLLIGVVVYVVIIIIGMIALPPQIKTIAYIILGLIVLFWLLDAAGLYSAPIGRL